MGKFIKVLLFFASFILLSLGNNSIDNQEDTSLSVPVSLSLSRPISPKETGDTRALREERFQDIESFRRIKGLDITSERLLTFLKACPYVEDTLTTQTISKSGIVEHKLELFLKEQGRTKESLASCEAFLYKHQSKLLAAKLSQLIPLSCIKSSAFAEVRASFLNSFLGEDTTELYESINEKLALSSPYKVANNSSQDYCFVYGNYVVDLSLSLDTTPEDSILVKIYISQNQ